MHEFLPILPAYASWAWLIPIANSATWWRARSPVQPFPTSENCWPKGWMPSPLPLPPTCIEELALHCIRHGVHVLVEKPIAPSVAEGRAIIAAARHTGVRLMVGHVERFNPTVEAIKDAIRAEDILSIAITRVGPFPPRMSNVGVVIDLAVHDIDLIRWFTESEIVEVQPQLSSAACRARGRRIAAVPHRLGSAGPHQHGLAHAIQGAERHDCDPQQIHHGDLLTRQVTECSAPARRQLFDAPPLGWSCGAVAGGAAGIRRGYRNGRTRR